MQHPVKYGDSDMKCFSVFTDNSILPLIWTFQVRLHIVNQSKNFIDIDFLNIKNLIAALYVT